MKPLNKYIDHTMLKSDAKSTDIEKLCKEAAQYDFASVCINPCHITQAKELLKDTDVKICTVIGFPLGANSERIKVLETQDAYAAGCDEFDMVINVGALKDKNYDYVKQELQAVIAAAKGKCVKVILETGLLTQEEIAVATRIACDAGATFVKTCTGFTGGVATVEAIRIMKENLSGMTRIKASAGIRDYETAAALIEAGAQRIGTSAGVSIIK